MIVLLFSFYHHYHHHYRYHQLIIEGQRIVVPQLQAKKK